MITYVMPTRGRPNRLKRTLEQIARLGDHAHCGGAEVLIFDNASPERLVTPVALPSGVPVHLVVMPENFGAAARNYSMHMADPRSDWLIMLDDDSYPLDAAYYEHLASMPSDVGAVSADIFLDRPGLGRMPRESGGLPEVFIGCGVAIRREVFAMLGGYDASFHYYVEEYDLAARMIMAGYRIVFDPRWPVVHAKDASRRDMNMIVQRLVRNNAWVAQRYAPDGERASGLHEVRTRYRAIARKERAEKGYARGVGEVRATLKSQPRTPMTQPLWDRFTGLTAVRETLGMHHEAIGFSSAMIIDPGKNAWAVQRVLRELGVELVSEQERPDVFVIGTLSPGPMLDALTVRSQSSHPSAKRVLTPWLPQAPTPSASETRARPAA